MTFIAGPGIPVPHAGEVGAIATSSWHVLFDVLSGSTTTPTTGAWPAANRALFLPFEVWSPLIVNRFGLNNGSTVSGNFDVGVYALNGARLVSSGSTAQTGASTIQEVDLTDTVLAAGLYYLGLAFDNATGTMIRWSAIQTQWLTVAGVQEMASAFPLPSTATFANPSSAYVPSLALSLRGVI